MAVSIADIFGSAPGPMGSMFDEPPVREVMGAFQNVRVPVSYYPGQVQNWSMNPNDREYVVAQTPKEHDDLLNKYYAQRKTDPQWKEKGRKAEQDSPHYSDKDNTLRKNLGARSSFVTDIVYDPETQRAMIQLGGGKYYTYSCTPDQLRAFMSAGSLGREINNIKWNHGTSMSKTTARQQPNVKSGGLSLKSLFGV